MTMTKNKRKIQRIFLCALAARRAQCFSLHPSSFETTRTSGRVRCGLPPYLLSRQFNTENTHRRCTTALSNNNDNEATETAATSVLARTNLSPALILWSFPILSATAAFYFYEETTEGFRFLMNNLLLSNQSFAQVDGGKLVGATLTPIMNGPVLTTISILFATLVATTISTLYARQVSLHRALSRQADEVRRLGFLLATLDGNNQQEAKTLLDDYTLHVYHQIFDRDFSANARHEEIQVTDQLFCLLNRIAKDPEQSSMLVSYSLDSLIRLEEERNNFGTTYQSVFPTMHYVLLATLAGTICFIFLLQANQDVVQFLVGLQLQVLWSILIGVFCTMAAICYDLTHPFTGSYSIMLSTDDELDRLRSYLLRPWDDVED